MDNPFDNAQELRRTQQEFRLQLAVVKHLQLAFPTLLWTHVANQNSDAKNGYFKRLMGSKAGCPDLLFWWRGGCGGIELKAAQGRVSSLQNKFLSSLHTMGVKTAVCRSVGEVHRALKSWGLQPKTECVQEPDTRSDMQKKYDAFEVFKPCDVEP